MKLEQALSEWPSWGVDGVNQPPVLTQVFTQGLNHAAAEITVDDKQRLVIKLYAKIGAREVAAQRWASRHELAPKIYYADPQFRYTVMSLADGHNAGADLMTKASLRAIGQSLKGLHSVSGAPTKQSNFEILHVCETGKMKLTGSILKNNSV